MLGNLSNKLNLDFRSIQLIMNHPTVKQLKYLCALAEHRHFGKAAEACYVSQSALSTAIGELEGNLGLMLFERSSQVLITPAGQILVAQGQQILRELENLMDHATALHGGMKHQLKLGVIPTIAPYILPQLLKAVRLEYGDRKLLIREDLSHHLLIKLAEGELDVLLFALPYETENHHVHPLFEDPLVLCLPAKHVLTEQQHIGLKDLKQHDILLLEDGHCLRDQALSACGYNPRDLSVPYQATSLSTLVQMVVNNIGITLLPEMAVNANVTHDTDAQIRSIDTQKNLSRTIALVWRKNSPRAAEFVQLGELISKLRNTQ